MFGTEYGKKKGKTTYFATDGHTLLLPKRGHRRIRTDEIKSGVINFLRTWINPDSCHDVETGRNQNLGTAKTQWPMKEKRPLRESREGKLGPK
jgi:hypothetical protein